MKLIEAITIENVKSEIKKLKNDFFILNPRIQYRVFDKILKTDKNGDIQLDIGVVCKMGQEWFHLIIYCPTDPENLEGSYLYGSSFHNPDLKDLAYDMAKKVERHLKSVLK